jgi:hypothetical protein
MLRRPFDRILVVVLLLALTISVAQASPNSANTTRQAAQVLADRAANAIARGDPTTGEELLRQAYEQFPAPTIAVLRARTLVYLQRLATAASVYESARFTRLESDSPQAFRVAVEQARTEAIALRPRVPQLQVRVHGRALLHPEMKVTLDGRLLPPTQRGRWILVNPGRTVVRAEWGRGKSERVVRVEERQFVVVEVSEARAENSLYKVISWGSLGIGVAGIGVGVVTGQIATSAHAQAVRVCPDERCVEGGPGADDLERFRTYRTISTAGYALGVVGVSVGAFLLIRGAPNGPALQVDFDRQSAVLHWKSAL